jgi:4-aminobutyrate aminotransferase
VTDLDGNVYLDATSGGYSSNVGYSHPKVLAAVKSTLSRISAAYLRPQDIHIKLAERLTDVAPGNLSNGLVGFCNTGAEGIELSIQTVKNYSKRPFLIAFQGAFHGRTAGALSLTTSSSQLRSGLPPLISDVALAPFPRISSSSSSRDHRDDASACLERLEEIFATVIDPKQVAAVYTEPVQAHAGMIIPPDGFFKKLSRLCHEHGMLLVDDESVTGFGRTGKMFGIEHWNTTPDMMCVAKAFACGLPLAAVIGRRNVMRKFPGGGTFSGSSLPFAAACANIDIIRREGLVRNAEHVGRYLLKRLNEVAEENKKIKEVRGKGLLIGIELEKRNGRPATIEAHKVVQEAFRKGLLITTCGTYEDVIRLSPPLTFTPEMADSTVNVISNVLRQT